MAVAVAVLTFDDGDAVPGYGRPAAGPRDRALVARRRRRRRRGRGVSRLLSVRPLAWIGDLSYSLYLWHWPVLVFGAAEFGEAGALKTMLLLGFILLLSVAELLPGREPGPARALVRVARGAA